MTTVKGGVDGFICFSLISVILFSYQDQVPEISMHMVVSTIHVFSFFLLYDLLFLNTLPTLLEKIMFCEKKLYDNRPFAHFRL
jgi:hypothetical protein